MTRVSLDELPFITWDDVAPGRSFEPFRTTVTEDDILTFSQVVRTAHKGSTREIPPGFVGVWGRRSYLEGRRMPPGGVLLSYDVRWLAPAIVGVEVVAVARVLDRVEVESRRAVTIQTSVTQNGTLVAEIECKLGWPS